MSQKTKKDFVVHSEGHPDLSTVGSPSAKKAFKRYSANCKKRSSSAALSQAPAHSTKLKKP